MSELGQTLFLPLGGQQGPRCSHLLCLRRFTVVLENHVVADDEEPALKRQRLEINCQDPSIKVSASLCVLLSCQGPAPLHRSSGPTGGGPPAQEGLPTRPH